MKNFFKSIGKAAVYFVVYLLTQTIVGFVYVIILGAKIAASGEVEDAVALSEQLTTMIMDKAVEMTFWTSVIALIIYWIRFAVRKKNILKEVEIKKISTNGILPILVMAPSLNVIISMVVSNIPWPQEWIDAYATNSSVLDGSLMTWISAVIMAPIFEEILFRGLVYTRLKKGMPTIIAAIVASLVFGLCHGTAIWIIYATVIGLVMTWVFERYQSLTASILFHFVFNAMGLAISMIPESMESVLWILLVVGVAGLVYGVTQILKVTTVESNTEKETITY